MLTIVDDLVSVDTLIEERLTVELINEYIQNSSTIFCLITSHHIPTIGQHREREEIESRINREPCPLFRRRTRRSKRVTPKEGGAGYLLDNGGRVFLQKLDSGDLVEERLCGEVTTKAATDRRGRGGVREGKSLELSMKGGTRSLPSNKL
ncbi:hypothetical protein Fmac_025288 [Flemingia macrophylla]|uniref:Uncharacterized protein n=1 Tax=Flemingia macrophylla TaxID=520843 RepID=A0ABD1LRU7_9FABA